MEDNNNNNNNNTLINLLLHGCGLARRMESELSWPPTTSLIDLSQKCDEIIAIFSVAKEHLNSMHSQPFGHHVTSVIGKGKEVAATNSGGQDQQRAMMMEVGGCSNTAPKRTPRRSSRNNEEEEGNKMVRVPAPQIGNTEMPPEDGFTWRKYGQKDILNSKFPRSYYRCTHQKLYNCPAKKQVQRLDDDPSTFEILYRGEHTCHNSSTAPSIPPPLSSSTLQDIIQSHPHHPITTVGFPFTLFSMDPTKPSYEGAHTLLFDHNYQLQQQLYRVSSSNSVLDDHNAEAGPSTIVRSHHGRDQAVDLISNPPLLDWTEVFNSGSSSSNSMEVIFPSAHDEKIN